LDHPDVKLLRCENEECLRVTCRACQKPDHLPKSCADYEADLKANSIHKVEEAMTAALVRKCPKCQQNYVKEYGVRVIVFSWELL
jgi:TRIAD3 protein (E3 ubiquitin-protein ligase RNF216)